MAVCAGAEPCLAAAAAGATLVQLRAPGASTRLLESEALKLVAASPVPVVVSSRADLALACGAAGVNLPEHDLPVAAVRRLLGSGRLLGRSVHGLGAALEAQAQGADYVIFGPVFESSSHPERPGRGLDALRELAAAVRIPVLAIGGVDATRAEECREAGAAGYAAISAFAAGRAACP